MKSVNTVYAQLVMDVGPESVAQQAARQGITSKLASNPGIAIGERSRDRRGHGGGLRRRSRPTGSATRRSSSLV